jgi:hypothetical protein
VPDQVDPLLQGRASFRSRAWRDAFAELSAADRDRPLPVADLERLAQAAYLLGCDDDARSVLERAYTTHLGENDHIGAARCAFWIGLGLLSIGEVARASGWSGRAGRLLDQHGEDCAERGYRLILDYLGNVGDLDAAFADAAAIAAIGERFRDADLVAFARYAQGDLRIKQGHTGPGLRRWTRRWSRSSPASWSRPC